MKLIHCADLHLDSKLNTNLSGNLASERRRELTDNFRRLVEYAADNGVSGVLICGDMFDTARVTAFTRNTVIKSMEDHPDIAFYLLKGNHDSESFIDEMEILPSNLYLFDSEWKSYDLAGVKIYGVELSPDNSVRLQQDFTPDPSEINIVMLHGQETETGSKDKAETINLRNFKNKGINYLALGHIHEYRRESLDGMGIYCYPGCLEGRGFDEAGEHGFVLLNVDTETGEIKDTFVPFAKRRIYVCPVDITGLDNTYDILSRVKQVLKDSPAGQGDMVKAVLTGEVDVECEKDLKFIEKSLEPDFYFVRVSDETVFKVDLDAFMLDETLKGEFVRLVMASEDLSADRKGQVVRMGLNLFSEVK
ncbi:MAG: DNA repair exonuclease [Lachnospiraceae bacterium]|nr:DNA repair exonuclease [Lachnospiraceae bacterium]